MDRLGKIERELAPESHKIQRTRRKIQESFEEQDKRITPEALKATVEKIYKQIATHKRVQIPNKPLKLFTHNQHVAPISNKVAALARMLQDALKRKLDPVKQ